ncbi:MAG: IS256 family transposase [Gemmatimonadales bacterium]|nr:MAG: IS256 family transposase [Gemmatimonadales bacterium]
MRKIARSEQLREALRDFIRDMSEVANSEEVLSELVRLATGLIVQESLEAEQRDFIGRARYERGERRGWRSGYERGCLDTAEGRVEVALPQVRGAGVPYRSKLYDFLRGDSEMLKRLATEMYARGLSTRDIEEAFTDEGGNCLLSRTGVSEVTEVLWQEYEAFQCRDLSDIPVLYLFLDGLYEPLRSHGVQRDAVLCAWAITLDGEKVLLSLRLGGKESYEAWLEFVRDLLARGLVVPLAVITDGAPGLIRVVEELWPKSLRLRCWVHKMRNVLAKVPDSMRAELKAHLVAIRDAVTLEAGQAAVKDFLARFGRQFPSACRALSDDLEALLGHLRLPWRHRKFVRTTNLIERSFAEERRRTKTLPRFFTEKSCLKLVHATLIRAARRWQRIRFSALEYEQLRLLFEQRGITPPRALEAVS